MSLIFKLYSFVCVSTPVIPVDEIVIDQGVIEVVIEYTYVYKSFMSLQCLENMFEKLV